MCHLTIIQKYGSKTFDQSTFDQNGRLVNGRLVKRTIGQIDCSSEKLLINGPFVKRKIGKKLSVDQSMRLFTKYLYKQVMTLYNVYGLKDKR